MLFKCNLMRSLASFWLSGWNSETPFRWMQIDRSRKWTRTHLLTHTQDRNTCPLLFELHHAQSKPNRITLPNSHLLSLNRSAYRRCAATVLCLHRRQRTPSFGTLPMSSPHHHTWRSFNLEDTRILEDMVCRWHLAWTSTKFLHRGFECSCYGSHLLIHLGHMLMLPILSTRISSAYLSSNFKMNPSLSLSSLLVQIAISIELRDIKWKVSGSTFHHYDWYGTYRYGASSSADNACRRQNRRSMHESSFMVSGHFL